MKLFRFGLGPAGQTKALRVTAEAGNIGGAVAPRAYRAGVRVVVTIAAAFNTVSTRRIALRIRFVTGRYRAMSIPAPLMGVPAHIV